MEDKTLKFKIAITYKIIKAFQDGMRPEIKITHYEAVIENF